MATLRDTSWEAVAGWYDKLLEGEGTYQKELILPNLLRLMDLKKGHSVLDLACGQGFFAREFAKLAGTVIGADASKALITIAQKNSPNSLAFHVASADSLSFLKDRSVDKVAIVLALQNIENVADVLRECARVIKKGGSLYIVLNHPAFQKKAAGAGMKKKKNNTAGSINIFLS
jgi:ubiquinone/menaquinone biosynthesis C-methylase UbiE